MHMADIRRYEPMCVWTDRLLWVDLTEQEVRAKPVGEYRPDSPVGRGLAARIAWELCPLPVDPRIPENLLVITNRPPSRHALAGFALEYNRPNAALGLHGFGCSWDESASIAARSGFALCGHSDSTPRHSEQCATRWRGKNDDCSIDGG